MARPRPFPFTEYRPDASLLDSADQKAKGVLSLTKRYAPLPDLSAVGTSARLNDQCLGAASFYSTTGASTTFLGDAGRLYRKAGNALYDVSKSGGYTAAPDWAWSFEQFGDNIVAVARGVDPQRFILGSSSAFEDLDATAPRGDVVFRIRQHLFICSGRTVNCSGFNNVTQWTPDPATQAFTNEVGQQAGMIVAGWGGEQGALFQERGIVRLTYQGGSAPFIFDEVEGGRGAVGPHAVAPYGRSCFVVAEDGIYVFDGLQMQPIGQDKVDRTFSNSLTYAYKHRTSAAIDVRRKSLMVSYPADGSTVPNRVLIYSWADGRWTHDDIDMQICFELHRDGVTMDDSAGITALFGTTNMDDAAFAEIGVDSPVWSESRKTWGAVNPSRAVCDFTGNNRAAQIETSEIEPVPGGMAFVSELWPQIDAQSGVQATLYARRRRLDQTLTAAAMTEMNDDGFCPTLAEGRFMRARLDIAAGTTWTECTGVHHDAQAAGER